MDAGERFKVAPESISTFDHVTDAELAEGFAALDRAVAAETTPRPVSGLSNLLVLGTKAA
jgi:hypothetical protein